MKKLISFTMRELLFMVAFTIGIIVAQGRTVPQSLVACYWFFAAIYWIIDQILQEIGK